MLDVRVLLSGDIIPPPFTGDGERISLFEDVFRIFDGDLFRVPGTLVVFEVLTGDLKLYNFDGDNYRFLGDKYDIYMLRRKSKIKQLIIYV